MPEQYVWRLVVDHWPTPNGQPFTEQSIEFWEQVINDYSNGVGPRWLPDDLSPYADGAFDPPRYIHHVGYAEEPDTGYPGSTLIWVPIAPTRRFFSRGPVTAMAKQLRNWGCRAHIERARVSDEWEAVQVHA